MSQLPRVPAQQRLMEETTPPVLMHPRWVQWLIAIVDAIQSAIQTLGVVNVTAHAATITATALPTGPLAKGTYRVSYTARITRAATSSSSLTVALGWTDGGVACSQTFAAITGNTTSTTQSGQVMANVDASTSITYAATYSSTGATTMTFSLSVLAEML